MTRDHLPSEAEAKHLHCSYPKWRGLRRDPVDRTVCQREHATLEEVWQHHGYDDELLESIPCQKEGCEEAFLDAFRREHILDAFRRERLEAQEKWVAQEKKRQRSLTDAGGSREAVA